MHKVICLIVEAESEGMAWTKLEVLRDLVCKDGHYDYGTFFNEDSPVSGASRWGQITPIARLDTPDGKQLIDRGLDVTKREFMEALIEVRKMLEEYTDEELYDGRVTNPKSKIIEGLKDNQKDFGLFLFRHRLRTMSDDKNYGWIYVLEGEAKDYYFEGVENSIDFETKFEGKKKKDFWIAPMDVHF